MEMKCRYCGSNLGIEDEVCPYCGKVNSQAAGHLAEMKKTRDEFESAKRSAAKGTKINGRIARLIVIAVMIVATMVMLGVTSRYSDVSTRIERNEARIKKAADRNKDDISATLKELEKNREYLAMDCYVLEHRLRSNDDYNDYARVFTAAISYSVIYEDILSIVDGFEGYEGEDNRSRCNNIGIYIADWKQYVDGGFWNDRPDSPMHSGEHSGFIKDARKSVQDMVQVYFDLSDFQVNEMWSMDRDSIGTMLYEKCEELYPEAGVNE
ncbi:MAG: zinc ribbon domain-containing protein [Lachnospiraceae bacterium]|nr:zinc ribbon domain-containing protein [Lachnospiraceae bacterium]